MDMQSQRLLTPAGRRGGVILVNPGISGVFLKMGPGTPLGVASLNLNFLSFDFRRSRIRLVYTVIWSCSMISRRRQLGHQIDLSSVRGNA